MEELFIIGFSMSILHLVDLYCKTQAHDLKNKHTIIYALFNFFYPNIRAFYENISNWWYWVYWFEFY